MSVCSLSGCEAGSSLTIQTLQSLRLQIIAVLHGQTCFMHKVLSGRKSSGAMARMDWDGREARALFDS